MRQANFKTVFCCVMALTLSTGAFAQSKTKIEHGDYELKVKQEKDEFKLKEKGTSPIRRYENDNATTTSRTKTEWRQGQTVTTVKGRQMPETRSTAVVKQTDHKTAGKRHYASRKACTCKPVAKRKSAARHAVAYRSKTRHNATRTAKANTTALTPVIVHDTVLVTRVDTVYNMMEQGSYTGYRQNTIPISSDFKEMKIEKEDGEINMKIEYEDGSKDKRSFPVNDDLNLHLKSDIAPSEYLQSED